MIHFMHAERLLALAVVLPAVLGLLYVGWRAMLQARERYGEGRLVDRYTVGFNRRAYLWRSGIWAAIVTLIVLAMAEPVAPERPDQVKAGSMQIVVVSDVSWSMEAEDYRGLMPGSPANSTVADGESGSRLDMAKYLMDQIMIAAPGNQIGVVTYMGEGWLMSDLASDYSSLQFVIDNFVTPGNAPGGGSDTGRGLKKALEVFKHDEDRSKTRVIVLFSDGGFDGDKQELQQVLSELTRQNIRLVVVGVGGSKPQSIPRYDRTTGTFIEYRKDEKGAQTTAIEEDLLRQLAQATGGEYHHVAPGQTSLDIHWANALGGSRMEPQVKPVYAYFLGGAFILLFVLSLPGLSRKRSVL